MNRIAVTELAKNSITYTTVVLLDENRKILDFQVYEPSGASLLNRIYIGRVENIVEGIHAAFVRISDKQKCFLPLEQIEHAIFTKKQSVKKAISIGDELLVQVTRDAIKTKDAVVSAGLTLQGKCCVLTGANTSLGVSKKIPAGRKAELSELLEQIGQKLFADASAVPCGIVLRTCAASFSNEEIEADIRNIYETYAAMVEAARHREAFFLAYQELPPYISRLKSMDLSQVDVIYTDRKEFFEQMTGALPHMAEKVKLYQDDVISLNRLYQVESTLERLLDKKVWLDSGANIIIEQLETLTFIDVNTAKNQSKKDSAILAVNCEAASEIARQIRLRNISGMILIDFINMKEADEAALVAHLKSELKQDSCPCHFIDITRLGLVELTRKKVHRSLREIFRQTT